MLTEELLNTKGSADFMKVSERTIQNYRSAGLLVPDAFGANNAVLYSKAQLIALVRRLLAGGETFLKKQPQVVKRYEDLLKICPQGVKSSPQGVKRSSGFFSKEYLLNFFPPKLISREPGDVTIFPATKHVEANDKLSEVIYYFTEEDFEDGCLIRKPKRFGLVEKPRYKNIGDIITTVELSLINEYTDTKPLNQYDRSVLAACISEWEAGNKCTTPNIIYRHLTGKTKSTDTPEPVQIDAILESIRKLMSLVISINMSDSCENLGYNNGKPFQVTSSVLPAMYQSEFTVNGQYTIVIHFDRESPILTVAKMKKQLLTYDLKLLDVPKQHNSVDTIAVKNYVLHRVQEIKLHKMTATITFDDVFQKCRLTEADNKKKLRFRKIILEFMDHLKNKDAILNYEVQKQGNKFHSITFSYKAKSKGKNTAL